MSDVSVTVHNVEDLFAGKIDFTQFEQGEAAMFEKNIASLAPAIQPAAQLALDTFKAGASAAVGVGQTALGALVNTATESQVTTVLNLMSAAGIPTTGSLSVAESAALTSLINGLKTGLDKIHLVHLTTPAAS